MKRLSIAVAFLLMLGEAIAQSSNNVKTNNRKQAEEKEYYTFPLSAKVTRHKVTFKNRYGITLAGDLYLPKDSGNKPLAALAISGPFGAVKEQSSGLYAAQMAE